MQKKKLKRYRLRINPDKGTTVDFISQVESPAIEVGFIKLASEAGNMDIFGYQTRFFQLCPGAQATFSDLILNSSGEDTTGMIRSAAQIADNVFRIESEAIEAGVSTESQVEEATILVDDFQDLIEEIEKIIGQDYETGYMQGHIDVIQGLLNGEQLESFSDYPQAARDNAARGIKLNDAVNNKCATQVGKVRAQQISGGEPLSMDTITRTYSFLSRAKTYYKPSDAEACGTISYLLWGGDEMLRWSESKMKKDDLMRASMASEQSDDKMELFGPVLIPDLPIYRQSEKMGEYEIVFKSEDIKEIAMNFMKSGYQNNVNLDHSDKMAKSYVFESFVSDEMVPNPKPFQDLPLGTWFVKMKVNDEELWSDIKSGKRNGFSIEGIFEYMVEEFERAHSKPETQTTKTIAEQEKTNIKTMIKDLFKRIFTELSQELGENAEGLSDYQMVASSDYKIEARQVGQKVEVVDPSGNLAPAADGAYEFEDGFKFMVKDGVIVEIDGKMPEEEPSQDEVEPMAKDKKKSYMDMLAEYPWDQCMMDMAEEGYDEETAKKICGSIKWQNMEGKVTEADATAELKSVKDEFKALKVQVEELKSKQISKDELTASITELKTEFKLVFEKFAQVPAEPAKANRTNIQKEKERQNYENFLTTIRKMKK